MLQSIQHQINQFSRRREQKEEDFNVGDGYNHSEFTDSNSNAKSPTGIIEPDMPKPLPSNVTPMKTSQSGESSHEDSSELPQVLGFSRKSSLDCIPSTIRRHHASSNSYANLQDVAMDDLTVCVPLLETMYLKFDTGSGRKRNTTTAVSQIVASITLMFAVVLYINHKNFI